MIPPKGAVLTAPFLTLSQSLVFRFGNFKCMSTVCVKVLIIFFPFLELFFKNALDKSVCLVYNNLAIHRKEDIYYGNGKKENRNDTER